jgi:uncharacterized protein (DUF58 family)
MPTARGWLVAALAAGCWLAGTVLHYPELAVLGLGGALALAGGWLRIAVPVPLVVHREIAPTRVPRGDMALGLLTCVHIGRLWRAAVTAVDRCGSEQVPVDLPRLRARRSYTTTYLLPTRRRGHVPVGPLLLTVTDPLGLVRRVRRYGTVLTLYVQPKTVPLATLPSGRLASLEGSQSQRSSGGDAAFHALRPYVFGDDLRHIHWRTSARSDTLMVRQLVDTSLPRTVVLLDTRASAYPDPDDFELAVDIAASVALASATRGFPVTVLGGDRCLSTLDGQSGQAAELLDRLALVDTRLGDDLPAAIAAAGTGRGGAALIVVTGAGAAADLPRFAVAGGQYDRAVVVRVGTDLPPLPPALPLAVLDAADLDGFAAAWRRQGTR